jgi:hypothetical protein
VPVVNMALFILGACWTPMPLQPSKINLADSGELLKTNVSIEVSEDYVLELRFVSDKKNRDVVDNFVGRGGVQSYCSSSKAFSKSELDLMTDKKPAETSFLVEIRGSNGFLFSKKIIANCSYENFSSSGDDYVIDRVIEKIHMERGDYSVDILNLDKLNVPSEIAVYLLLEGSWNGK